MKAAAAILLLQLNLALVAEPALQQAAPLPPASTQTQAGSATSQAAPEAPTPTASGTASAPPSLAQEMKQEQQKVYAPPTPFQVAMPHSHNPLAPYRASTAPELDLNNSPRLQNLIRDGKIYLSLRDAIAVAIENNLDLAYFRYNFPIAQTDILRTKAGSTANGVNTAIVQGTQGGFAASTGGGGGSSGSGFSAGNGGIVTSTLGAGTSVSSFDPYLTFKGYVDHTVTQEANQILTGVPVLKTNTIEVLSNLLPVVPHRHERLDQLSSASVSPATLLTTSSIPSCIPISRCKSPSPFWPASASPPTSALSALPSATPRSPTLLSRHRSSPP